jgi:ABC-type sulfate/molybdate transport systems ATPase subunit
MTVADNIAFGLKIRRWKVAAIRQRVAEVLDWVHLAGYEKRYPEQLSGGQRQRVALARALAVAPRLLLLDEPFSQLDAHLRLELRHELRHLQQQLGLTTLFVTHDQIEAVTLADRIALLMQGQVVQVGAARSFYDQPRSAAVARFFGASNIYPAHKSGTLIQIGTQRLQVQNSDLPDGQVLAMIRPETIQLGANGANTLAAQVQTWTYQGEHSRGVLRWGDFDLHISSPPYVQFHPNQQIEIHIAREHIWLMPMEEKNV